MTIKKINKKKHNEISRPQNQIISYTIFGKHTSVDIEGFPLINHTSTHICAQYQKKTDVDGKAIHRYFIRRGDDGTFYNPIGMYESSFTKSSYKKATHGEYTLREVQSKVFKMYLQFLKTKNQSWLKNAEREAI